MSAGAKFDGANDESSNAARLPWMPAPLRSAKLVILAATLGACARQGAPPPQTPKGDGTQMLLVDPKAYESGEQVFAAWLAYGLAKLKTYQEQPPPPANESADDFAIELAGRDMQATFWADLKQKESISHPLFDREIEIQRAGLLPELVIGVHGKPGWTVPGAALSKLRFQAFVEKFAGNYQAATPVHVKTPSGKVLPDVPGDDFPDPAAIPMGAASCGTRLDERNAAWSRFDALAKRLGGVPVSALSTIDFAKQLIAAKDEDAHRTRGVTWVSAKVGYLATLDAFCAVERKNWPEATRSIARAITLRPGDAGPRLEMALALTAVNRPDDALAQVTRAMSLTHDGCTIGLAWRRRGYILVEKGALDAAEDAYKNSLKYDPSNRIAKNELVEIAERRRTQTSRTPDPPIASVPPFGMTVTECRATPR